MDGIFGIANFRNEITERKALAKDGLDACMMLSHFTQRVTNINLNIQKEQSYSTK